MMNNEEGMDRRIRRTIRISFSVRNNNSSSIVGNYSVSKETPSVSNHKQPKKWYPCKNHQ